MDILRKVISILFLVLPILLIGCGGNSITLSNLDNVVIIQDSFLEFDLNSNEPEGVPYAYKVTVPPKYGTLKLGRDYRHLIYTPFKNYFGPDSFEFQASDGKNTKSANATLRVNDVFIANRPMAVKIYEIVSLDPGELKITWFNSYDIDGPHSSIRYHIHISENESFYPSDETLVQTVTNQVTTTIKGLAEGKNYAVAILAEDSDGKLSKTIDRKPVHLAASKLVLQPNIDVLTTDDIPFVSAALTTTEISIALGSTQPALTGKILQLDRANDYAFVKLHAPISINTFTHRYSYSFAKPEEFIKDIEFTYSQGGVDPKGALIQYYEETAGSIELLKASRMTATAAEDPGSAHDELIQLLMEWSGLTDVEDLYEIFNDLADGEIDESDIYECGTFDPTFEPLDPFGITYDRVELELALSLSCSFSYTYQVKWKNLLTEKPQYMAASMNVAISSSVDIIGRAQRKYDLYLKELPRNLQIAKTRWIPIRGKIKLPFVVAINFKGRLQAEHYGEFTSS